MTDVPSPSGRDELIQFISEFVRGQFEKTGAPPNGAQLDYAIKLRYGPEFSYRQLGLERLAQAVQLAEAAGLIVRNWKVKHLELFPAGVRVDDRVALSRPPAEPKVFLRKEVWQALLYYTPWEHRYLKRETGEVVPVAAEQKESYASNADYVRIDPVPPNTQKTWMKEFLAVNKFADGTEAPVDAPDWWRSFTNWLRVHGESALKAWLVYRTQQVVAYARTWAHDQGVAEELLLSRAFQPAFTRPHTGYLPTNDAAPVAPQKPPDESDQTRRAILAALEEMSTDELAELAIPLRYMLRHFKAR